MKRHFNMIAARLNRKTILLIMCLQTMVVTSAFAYDNLEIKRKIAQFEQGLSAKNIGATMQPFKIKAVWQGFGTYAYVKENVAELFTRYKSVQLIRSTLELSQYDRRVISSANYQMRAVTMQGKTVELPVSFVFLWENDGSGWEIIAINPVILVPVNGSLEDELKMIDPGTTVIPTTPVPDNGTATSDIDLNNAGTTAVPNTAGRRVLHPISDSHVYAYSYLNWNKANWGKYDVLAAGWHPVGGEKRTYLMFDLSGVDSNQVGKATLRLFLRHKGGGNTIALGVYRATSAWVEGRGTYKPASPARPGEISWVNQPTFAPNPIARFNPEPGENKWVEVDITPLVKAWLSGTPNHGLVIKPEGYLTGNTPEAQYGFYSREAEEAKRPALVLSNMLGRPDPGNWISPTATNVFRKNSNTFERTLILPCAPNKEFVRSLYNCVLHREPSARELHAQIGRLQSGMSRQGMVTDFLLSPEYEKLNREGARFITDACQAIYARQPTEADLHAWPRTRRGNILAEMFMNQAHLSATRDCATFWRHSTAESPKPGGLDSEPTQDSAVAQAYKEYMDAHNVMARLMAAGKGDTPEGRNAYANFMKAKNKYETSLQRVKLFKTPARRH